MGVTEAHVVTMLCDHPVFLQHNNAQVSPQRQYSLLLFTWHPPWGPLSKMVTEQQLFPPPPPFSFFFFFTGVTQSPFWLSLNYLRPDQAIILSSSPFSSSLKHPSFPLIITYNNTQYLMIRDHAAFLLRIEKQSGLKGASSTGMGCLILG